LNYQNVVINAEDFLKTLFWLAREFEGQPVSIIEDGGLKVGVMNLTHPTDDDWCLRPVPVADLPTKEYATTAGKA
jgi:hypothetical protein